MSATKISKSATKPTATMMIFAQSGKSDNIKNNLTAQLSSTQNPAAKSSKDWLAFMTFQILH